MAEFVSLCTMAETREFEERNPCSRSYRSEAEEGHVEWTLAYKGLLVRKSQWKCSEKRNREKIERKERSPSNDCSKTISKKIHLTFFLSFRNPPRIITRSFPFSLPSRSISLFNFHDRATPFRRESSSFPLCLRLALCNEKCARNRYFSPPPPGSSSFRVYSVRKS